MNEDTGPPTKSQERRAFLLLTVFMAPVLAVLVVSGYGFLVWMIQLIGGPPS
jgi:nitrate reductase NapE